MELQIMYGFIAFFGALVVFSFVVSYFANVSRNGRYRAPWYIATLVVVALRLVLEGVFCLLEGFQMPLVVMQTLVTSMFVVGNGIFQCFFHLFAERFDFPAKQKLLHFVDGFFVAVAAVIVVAAFFGVFYSFGEDGYTRSDLYPLLGTLTLAAIVCALGSLLVLGRSSRKDAMLAFSFVLPPMLGVAMYFISPFLPWFTVGIVISVQICNATMYAEMVETSREAELNAAQHEAALSRNRNVLMLSQIRPHFLYNTLGAVAALCDDRPQDAKQLTLRFSRYLRHNIKSLSTEELISFSEELDHARAYLDIEQVRFGDRLRIEWRIDYKDFFLPALTLQPLVENAVKHGVEPRYEGGTVIISSWRQGDCAYFSVEDDGVGFDREEISAGKEDHIGLSIISQRLQLLSDATLHIESEPGLGTKVTGCVPLLERR